jgi:hypothetical protein
MIDLFESAREFQDFCDRQGWRSCVIGGIAVNRWGRPRVTRDVDSAEELIVMKLFASRAIDVRDAEGVAIRNRRHLDWQYIEEQLRPLTELKEAPEILRTLAQLRAI